MSKMPFLEAAEVFDSWRVVPRIIIFLYCWFVYRITLLSLVWYFHEPKEGRGTQETAVILGVLGAITGLAGYIFKVYTDAGRDWSTPVPSTTTTVQVAPAATVTTTAVGTAKSP